MQHTYTSLCKHGKDVHLNTPSILIYERVNPKDLNIKLDDRIIRTNQCYGFALVKIIQCRSFVSNSDRQWPKD